MQSVIHSKELLLMRPEKTGPCVSIILPFEPKMSSKSKLEYRAKKAVEAAERQLLEKYPFYRPGLLVKKLKEMISSLDFSTHKKSVALFACPDMEKIYYLDIFVEEKIIVDQSCEIRDIVLNKKLRQQYLLLLLSTTNAKIFLGNRDQLTRLVTNASESIEAYKNDVAERVSNFSDPQHRKEVLIKKFIRHIDDGLRIILQPYPLPLFLACTKKTRGYFMQLSKNKDHVVEYIPGSYNDWTDTQLKSLVQPFIEEWQKIKEKDLVLQLDRAMDNAKCSVGMKEVFKTAGQKRGRLLVVEKGFSFPAFIGKVNELNLAEETLPHNSIYIKDAVNDVIEKVLENGGDVEFVSDGLLKDYMHIAMIQFY